VPKVSMSFEQKKTHLLKRMISKKSGKKVERVVDFPNNDVPVFLRDLDKFERSSVRSRVMVK